MINLSPINRQPAGLLGALDIKAMGANPKALSSYVSPIVDIRDLYTQPAMTRVFGPAVSVTATGGFIPAGTVTQVPTGKVWFAHQVTALTNAVLGAGTTLRGSAAIYDADQTFVWVGPVSTFTVGELGIWTIDGPKVMFPGHQLGFICNGFAGLATNVQLIVRRLEVDQ